VAAAVGALAAVDVAQAAGARKAGDAALAHADPRVRASAVETIARWRRRGLDAPLPGPNIEAKDDPHHRVRANAALAVLDATPGSQDAARALLGLLESADPVTRRAGAWASARAIRGMGVERRLHVVDEAWAMIAARLGTLAHEDADPGVRARATMALPALPLLGPTLASARIAATREPA
jgi:hypothetical protein